MTPSLGSIRAKTSLLFFLLFVCIILPVNLVIYRKISSALEEANQREMASEAEKLLGQVKLDPLIVPLPANYDLQLVFRGALGDELLFSSPGFPSLPSENLALDFYAVDSLEVFNVREDRGHSGQLLLSLARTNHAMKAQLNELRIYLFVVSTVALALTGFLVYLAAGWMLRPIHEIAEFAGRIHAAETIERIPVPGTRDESRKLAEAINAMLERIEKTMKNQTNFFASATHELKTPLAIMKAELGTAEENPHLKGLLAEVERLDHVISDFLLISQLKSDSLIIRRKPEPIDEIVYSALRKIKYLKDQYRVDIQVTLPEDHPRMVASVDGEKMETVFVNLLENAVRYACPRQLSITIKADDGVIVEIVNPVAEPLLDTAMLTQEFTKSGELSAGLGMGLWICDQILRLHAARLVLEQTASTFHATVILAEEIT